MYKIDDLKYRRSSWIKNASIPGPHRGKELSDCTAVVATYSFDTFSTYMISEEN